MTTAVTRTSGSPQTLEELEEAGLQAVGQVEHHDPYTAIQNALQFYAPDDIVISTFPETRSGWLRGDLSAGWRPPPASRSSTWSSELMESASIAADVAHDEHHHGPPAANVSSRVEAQFLGMLLFIISEVMLFGAFFTAYFFIRVVNGDQWFPVDGNELPKVIAGFNTAILISSSFTMHWALEGARNENRNAMRVGLLTTFLLGLTFLTVQINEYVHLGFAPHDNAQAHDLLRPHRPARRARVRRPDAAVVRDHPRLQGPLHGQGAPRRGGAGHLLALRRRDVDRRVLHGLPP